MSDPWPWPTDSVLERARRVAGFYRHALQDVDPQVCAALDRDASRLGQGWVVPSPSRFEPDDLLTTAEAAQEFHVSAATIRKWVHLGLTRTRTESGSRYRLRDLHEFDAARRKRRGGRAG